MRDLPRSRVIDSDRRREEPMNQVVTSGRLMIVNDPIGCNVRIPKLLLIIPRGLFIKTTLQVVNFFMMLATSIDRMRLSFARQIISIHRDSMDHDELFLCRSHR
jgi:hypothetical protein